LPSNLTTVGAEISAIAFAAGLLAHGSTRARTFPTHVSVVQFRACSPLTVAGAAEVSHPVPFSAVNQIRGHRI